MTYKQIEEALKYCPTHNFNRYCGKCELDGILGCRNELMKKTLSYIENLKEEKETARKAAAEKILFKFESAFAYYDNEDMFSKKAIFECLEEIVKSCGVEIKEYEK